MKRVMGIEYIAGVRLSVYDLTRAQVATAIEMLLNHREFSLQDADVVSAALDR
jgi:predicted nucleic-acid-binding protein